MASVDLMNTFTARNKGDSSWFHQAACAGKPTAWFFPRRVEGGNTAAGKAVCFRCPVRLDCLEWALRNHEAEGTWGGLSPKERQGVARRRRLRNGQ